MKCSKCGKEIADDSKFCENCGEPTIKTVLPKASVIGIIISFLIPLIGFLLCGINKKKNPTASKKYIWWAKAGLIFGLILRFIVIYI